MGSPAYTLREYRPADLETMHRLDQVCFEPQFRFDRDTMREFAERPSALALLAEQGVSELAGFVIVHIEQEAGRRYGYVVTLDVAPSERRHGLATLLMKEAERRAAAAGASLMGLHVFTGNIGAIRFYERIGYELVGAQPRFYGHAGLDALLYRKMLHSV